jgi:hypothetical protein
MSSMCQIPHGETRRDFIRRTTLVATALRAGPMSWHPAEAAPAAKAKLPWYRRTLRWGQTNITDIDPIRYDIAWWRTDWGRTHTQGVIINADGIVAYYPSRVPLHRPAQQLGGRDHFGELCCAAHEDGLVVFARMDSNRAHEEFYRAHPVSLAKTPWEAAGQGRRGHRAGAARLCSGGVPGMRSGLVCVRCRLLAAVDPADQARDSMDGGGDS